MKSRSSSGGGTKGDINNKSPKLDLPITSLLFPLMALSISRSHFADQRVWKIGMLRNKRKKMKTWKLSAMHIYLSENEKY